MITSFDQLDLNKTYSYADYLTWQFSERVELFRGRVFRMSPAPNRRHQEIAGEIFYHLKFFVRQGMCKVFTAPFDVRLPLPENKQKKGKVDTVVQPDIVVVCDPSKLDEQGCNGAPDFIVEILSLGNSRREMKTKFELYETAGVKEYWLVEPLRECVTCYHLDATGQYVGSRPYFAEDDIPSRALEGFVLKGRDILNELADLD